MCKHCGNVFTKAVNNDIFVICSKCRKRVYLVEGFYRIPKGDPIPVYAKNLHYTYKNNLYSEMFVKPNPKE